MYLHVLKSTCYSQTESNLFALVPKCSRNRSCAGIRTFWGRKWMWFSVVSFAWSFVIWKDMLFSPQKAGIRNQGHPFWTRHFECPGSGMKALRWVEPMRWEKLLQQRKHQSISRFTGYIQQIQIQRKIVGSPWRTHTPEWTCSSLAGNMI